MIKQVTSVAVAAAKAGYKMLEVCGNRPKQALLLAIAIDAIRFRSSGGTKGFVASLPETPKKDGDDTKPKTFWQWLTRKTSGQTRF